MKRIAYWLVIAGAALVFANGCTSATPNVVERDLGESIKTAAVAGAPEKKIEGLKAVGSIDFIVYGPVNDRGYRPIKEERYLTNLVVDAGKAGAAGLLNGVVTNFFEHIAIGTGTTAAAAGDTACQTEIASGGGSRAAGTTSRVTTDVTNDTAQVEVTYNFTSSFAVTESCLLDSITTGTLLSRQVFSAINVANGDSLLIRWKIDVD